MPDFSNQTTLVYLAISNARVLCPLHIFTIALSTIMGMKYLLVILICVFLMTNDDECLFCALIGTCLFSMEKCLFGSFVHFKTGYFSTF